MSKAPQHSTPTTSTKMKLGILALAQFGLATYAGIDLARRPKSAINGPKQLWFGSLAINWIGPTAYLLVGRKDGLIARRLKR